MHATPSTVGKHEGNVVDLSYPAEPFLAARALRLPRLDTAYDLRENSLVHTGEKVATS